MTRYGDMVIQNISLKRLVGRQYIGLPYTDVILLFGTLGT